MKKILSFVLIAVMSLSMAACEGDLNTVDATVAFTKTTQVKETIVSLAEEYALSYDTDRITEIAVYEFDDMYNAGDTDGNIKVGNVERSSTFPYPGGEMGGEIKAGVRLVSEYTKEIIRKKVSEKVGFDVNTVLEIPIKQKVEVTAKNGAVTCDIRIIYECTVWESISVERPVGMIAILYNEK